MTRPASDRMGYEAYGTDSSASTVTTTDIYGLADFGSTSDFYVGRSSYTQFDPASLDDPTGNTPGTYQATQWDTASAEDLMTNFIGQYGTSQYDQMQDILYAGGYYGTKAYSTVKGGTVDDDTNAMAKAMKSYQQARAAGLQMTWAEFLSQSAQRGVSGGRSGSGSGSGGGGGGGRGAAISYTDPEVIKSVYRTAAQQLTGKALPEDELDAKVAEWHAKEGAAAYGGDQPNLQADATADVRENHRTEVNEHGVGLLSALTASLLSGGSSGISTSSIGS